MNMSQFHIAVVVTAAFVLAATAPLAALTPVAPPQLYADQGWTQMFEARGDLNRDGLDDRAVILQAPDTQVEPPAGCDGQDDYSDAPVRRLIVLFGEANGGETLVADEPQSVLRSDQGGMIGDSLVELRIERGAIVIENYGGSRHRWADTMRFRHDDDTWRLIGWTHNYIDSLSASIITYDYNPLTEKMQRTVDFPDDDSADIGEPFCIACRIGEKCPERHGCFTGSKPAKNGERWFTIGPRKHIPMAGFLCWWERVGLLRHLGFEDGR